MRRFASLTLLFLCSCASDPATWRPARHAKEYPPEKGAYRIDSAGPECDEIGVVHAQRSRPGFIEDIAETAANHGGTHFVIREDARPTRRETVTTVTAREATLTTPGETETRTHKEKSPRRHPWAQVYRCP